MSELVIILAESGSGKSTAIGKNEALKIKGLNPSNTRIINVMGKALPFPQSKVQYNEGKKNYSEGRNVATTLDALKKAKNRPEIKNVVIDDFQYLLAGMFIDRMNDSDGFKKWNLVLEWVWVLLNESLLLRNDQIVFILSHLEYYNEEGEKLRFNKEWFDKFWNWCRKMSEHNIVFISEYKMPKDFKQIYKIKSRTAGNPQIERLFLI